MCAGTIDSWLVYKFTEGKEFVKRLGATAIPIHCGLFDEIDLNDFDYKDKIVFKFYEEKEF